MPPKSPLVTLLAGLATGVVLLTLSLNATPAATPPASPGAGPATPPASPSAVPTTPRASATSAPPDRTRATFAGRTQTRSASIALAIRDGRAIAYVCDGNRLEVWLMGTAAAGKLALTGKNNARLNGTFSASVAAGSGTLAGSPISFRVRQAERPSGLYRVATTVRNAKVVGGWIVLADGTQVGVLTTDQTPAPAPSLDTSTGEATVAGTPVVAGAIDGTTGSGF